MVRSIVKSSFVHSLQRLIPEITAKDLVSAPSPAATASLQVGRLIASKLADQFQLHS